MTTSVAPHVSSAGSTPAQNALPSDIRNHEASSSAAATRITQVDMVEKHALVDLRTQAADQALSSKADCPRDRGYGGQAPRSYVAETMGVVIGTVAILSGIVLLVKGSVPQFDHVRSRTVRLVGLAVFPTGLVNALGGMRARSRASSGRASTASGGVWALLLLLYESQRAHPGIRGSPPSSPTHPAPPSAPTCTPKRHASDTW
jgi:hypothetical protein